MESIRGNKNEINTKRTDAIFNHVDTTNPFHTSHSSQRRSMALHFSRREMRHSIDDGVWCEPFVHPNWWH